MTVAKSRAMAALLGLVILGWSGTARAEYLEFGPLEAVSTVYISTTPAYGGYSNLDVYDGQYGAQLSANLSMTPAQEFNTFCVDLADEVSLNQVYAVNLLSTSDGLTNGPQIAYLYENYGVNTINGGGSYSESWLTNTASGSGSEYAAGLQLAIWDLLANNGATSGNLNYTGESANTANFVSFFLYQATSNTGYAQWADSHTPQPDGYTMGQSFLVPAAVMINTPEPSTLTLVGLGLACMAACSAWRGKRSAR
jgi:PEP-CTERM motif